jgi:Ca2+-transporting ATPase
MGERGTDVAREASTLVLLDDQFSSIVAAVKLGRRIFINLQTAMTYIMAIHVPVAGLALLPVMTGLPAILLPMHVALLELMIDPVCSIVFEAEPEASDIMTMPPRNRSARLFSSNAVFQGLIAGFASLMVVIAVDRRILSNMGQEDHGRAVAFACLIMVNIALITTLRPGQRNFSFRQILTNKTLWFAIPGLIALMAVIFYVEPVASALHFVPPHMDDLVNVGLIGVICAGVFTGLRKVPFFA